MAATSTYKAVLLERLSPTAEEGVASLQLREKKRETLRDKHVRVSVKASAVNFFDLLITCGQYQTKPPLPHVMCTEGSGVITEVGPNVTRWKVGDAVLVGLGGPGTAAEELVCHERTLIAKPALWSFTEAAAFPVGYFTTYHALVHRGQLRAGETLLVTGAAGGMGASCIQLGKKLGATVIACASSGDKLEMCRQLGADHVIDYSTENLKDRVTQITKGKMVDVVYEVVGGTIFDQCARSMAPGGRLLVIGFASGTIPKFAVNLALVKGFSLVGVRSGAELARQPHLLVELDQKLREWTHPSLPAAQARQLAPVILPQHIYDAESYRDAFKVVAQRNIKGKSVIVLGDRTEATRVPTSASSSAAPIKSRL